MVDSTSESPDVTKKLILELLDQRRALEEQKKHSYQIGPIISVLIATLILAIVMHSQALLALLPVIQVVLLGSLFFATILLAQFQTLRQEIRNILPEFREPGDVWKEPRPHQGRSGSTIVNKIYDVNKNTIDKLYDKLNTFSKTWLAVSGGIGSGIVVEIFKSGSIDFTSAATVVLCSTLLWSIAQNAVGVLDYDLSEKTKDLGIWWLRIVAQTD